MKLLNTLAAVALATLSVGTAQAYTITAPASIAASYGPLVNFGTATSAGFVSGVIAPSNGITFTVTPSSPGSMATGLYAGTITGASTPFASAANALREYIAVQPGGSVTETFSTAQTSLGLLWGSVDSYNSLSILVGGVTISGSQIASALGFTANGLTTSHVVITGLSSFTQVVFNDTTASAFEFVPAVMSTAVPEPLTLTLLASGLVGLGLVRRRKSTQG